MKILFSLLLSLFLLSISLQINAQNQIDTINNILEGEWFWIECIPAPFECMEQPSENLSRSIRFTAIDNSDSLIYETIKNDTLVCSEKTILTDIHLPRCFIQSDVVFCGDTVSGIYSGHTLIIENDTIIKFMLGPGKSSICYKYKKKGIINNIGEHRDIKGYDKKNIVYSDETILLNIDRLDISTNLVFKLINIQGSIIYQKRLNGNKCINIGNIPSGIYLGVLYSDNHLLYSEKIIIY